MREWWPRLEIASDISRTNFGIHHMLRESKCNTCGLRFGLAPSMTRPGLQAKPLFLRQNADPYKHLDIRTFRLRMCDNAQEETPDPRKQFPFEHAWICASHTRQSKAILTEAMLGYDITPGLIRHEGERTIGQNDYLTKDVILVYREIAWIRRRSKLSDGVITDSKWKLQEFFYRNSCAQW